MKIEYYHASRYGNGAMVAEEFRNLMAARGVLVNVHHVREARPKDMPAADLYLLSSPGRFGKPIGDMKHFVKEVNLPSGGKYAVLVTELRPKSSNGLPPAPVEGSGKCQQVIPFMDAALQKKGLIKIAEGKVFVTGLKGPLEEGWQDKVAAYASRIAVPTRA